MNAIRTAFAIAVTLLFMTCSTVRASAPRIPQASSVFFEQPLATVEGAASLWVNPANLVFRRGNEFLLMGTIRDDAFLKDWGTASRLGYFGLATRKLFDLDGSKASEYAIGVGFPIQTQGGLGFGYRYFPSGPEGLDNRHQWSVGFSWRSSRSLSFAAMLNNLNRGYFNGERTQVEHHYSIALRPESEWLTVSADIEVGSGQRFGDALWSYEAKVRPKNGLIVEAKYRTDDTWQLGLRLNLVKEFFGSRSGFDRKGMHQQSVVYTGLAPQAQASVMQSPQRAILLNTANPGESDLRPVFGTVRSGFARKLLTLSRATADPKVNGIYVVVDGGLHFSQAYELREQLVAARQAGKHIACYLGSRSNVAYYLASMADEIIMPPATALELVGLRAELSFYAETLKKLGLEADLLAFGRYKSAVEPFTRDSASQYYTAQVNQLLDSLAVELVRGISIGRGLSVDSVRQLIDLGPFPAQIAKRIGLIDSVMHREQFLKLADRAHAISLADYVKSNPESDRWDETPQIAIVVAEGEVLSDNSGGLGQYGARLQPGTFKRALDQAVADPSVAGIIVRINSPGGLSVAGELIRFRAAEAAKKKPLWISMSSLAASAGYDLATAGHKIYANPLTITGSIGIFGGKISVAGLYKKIGLTTEIYTRGRNAAMTSTSRPFTDSEREGYRGYLAQSYREFIAEVATSRHLTEDSVATLAEGRIYTGREAVSNGLADRVGTLTDAVHDLADSLGLEDYETLIVERRMSWWTSLRLPEIPGIFGRIFSAASKSNPESGGSMLDDWTFARLPFDLDVN